MFLSVFREKKETTDCCISNILYLKKRLIFKKEAGKIFGNQKDRGLESILGAITQTFDNKYLYKSIEEQAANLLYLIINL